MAKKKTQDSTKVESTKIKKKTEEKKPKYAEGKVAVQATEGVENFDPEVARAEVEAIMNDVSGEYELPKFLRSK